MRIVLTNIMLHITSPGIVLVIATCSNVLTITNLQILLKSPLENDLVHIKRSGKRPLA